MALLRQCLAELRSKHGDAEGFLMECGPADARHGSACSRARTDVVSRYPWHHSGSMPSGYVDDRARRATAGHHKGLNAAQ
jgi:hypothetical protein